MDSADMQRECVEVGGVSFDTVVLGDGQPAVVFVNGLGSPLEEWALVAPTIAGRCRVVCYDRPAPPDGTSSTHDASKMAADLQALLNALGVTGRVVLVGHSWGGAIIRRYAFAHPDAVAGLVFVDASHENIAVMTRDPGLMARALYASTTSALRFKPLRRRLLRMLGFDRLPAVTLASLDDVSWRAHGRSARAEYAGIARSLRELGQIAPDLPKVPTRILLGAGRPGLTTKLAGRQLAAVRAAWDKAAVGNGVTVQAIAESGHYISLDQPQAVIDAINEVLDECRGLA